MHPQEADVREEALLTANNGRPVAVLLPVDAGTVDETLKVVRRARGLEALRAIRRESQSSGTARMTPADIDALVTRTRAFGTAAGSPRRPRKRCVRRATPR